MTVLLVSAGSLLLNACGAGSNSLPSQIDVDLPDGTTVTANKGDGVVSLTNSSWTVFRRTSDGAAQGASLLTLTFDGNGALQKFENSTIASDIFGPTLFFDSQVHNTTQQGLTYTAATFGAATTDGVSFAFEARMVAFFAGLRAANGSASASGSFVDDDTIHGDFAYKTQVTLAQNSPIAEQGNQEDAFPFVAYRVVASQRDADDSDNAG